MRAQLCDAPKAEPLILRTASGTAVRVGRRATGESEQDGRRIGLYIGPDGKEGAREALTPAEARQLAAAREHLG